MTFKEETDLFFSTTLGSKSHLNLLGKVVFSPIIIFIYLLVAILHISFTKKS